MTAYQLTVNGRRETIEVLDDTPLGLSAALNGKITVEEGRVVQSNFHDYPPLRIGEMPEVEVLFLQGALHQPVDPRRLVGAREPGGSDQLLPV